MYQGQWKSSNTLFVSPRQLYTLPSDEGHQRLLSTWEFLHFEANVSTSPACSVRCLHESFCRSYGVRNLSSQNSLQANTNPRSNPVHQRVLSEWAWMELLVKKWLNAKVTTHSMHGRKYQVRVPRCDNQELVANSHFSRLCLKCGPSVIFTFCCLSRYTLECTAFAACSSAVSHKRCMGAKRGFRLCQECTRRR